jgi:glycosyltransferase involved in cell wall biosynthesis
LRTDSDDASQILFREFDRQTRDSRLTVGVVMRMDENKRPLLWVQAAESILEKFPSARFILVGDGQLRCQAINWVRKRGIDRRFLFVGVSHYVGFWLSKMDLFLLLSKREGLPNALIEAQLSGIPAVITPAGGAPEALLPGITGVITSPDPTAEEVATTVIELARKPDRLRIMGEVGVRWATESFSMARMLRETIALMAPDEQKLAGFDALPCVEDYTAEADAD